MNTGLSTYRQAAADALRAYPHAEESDRTALLHEAAGYLVDARSLFYTADGTPDWRGRSYAYRRWVGDVYNEAGLPRDVLPTVQAAVRYHVGNVLRERLSADELAGLGLRSVGPRERSVEKRNRQALVLALFEGGPFTDPGEIVAAVETLSHALDRIPTDSVAKLDTDRRRTARKHLRALSSRAEKLTAAAGGRRR